DIVRAVVQALNVAQGQPVSVAPDWPSSEARPMTSPSSDSQSSGFHNWNQIKFASKLIPSFAGKEDENIIPWLERIASIARMYRISDEALVVAAVNQLSGRVLGWYNRQRVESVASWQDFKRQIRLYFERKETVTMTLSRINARVWRAQSEKFIDYAEDKLKLMQFLTLTEKEKIELLVDGVKDFAFRKFALNSWATNVPEFLEQMRRISEDGVVARRTGVDIAGQRTSPRVAIGGSGISCSHCKKPGHLARDCRVAAMTCFACGQRGHLSSACQRNRSVPGTTLNHLAEVSVEEEEPQSEEAAKEEASSGIYVIEGETPYIAVSRCGFSDKSFRALVDAGSPVSLIRKSIYQKYFASANLFRVGKYLNLKGINNSEIKVHGKIFDQICLEGNVSRWFDVTLLVVDDSTIAFDVLLGREFLINSKVKLIYQNGRFKFKCPAGKPEQVDFIFQIGIDDPRERCDVVMENLDGRIDGQTRERLADLLHKVEKLEMSPVVDNYQIRVHMRDPSLFRYAPLLVEKRNEQKRMCVDLRPLNQRIYPQKYPFPIIEDQINQLQGKCVYSKLDLKDGFHQIDIHPEDTKYFAFSVPHGQFEYIKMPFGYSEAPAKFQKRIYHILDPLIRSEKILVYMDDILIATSTIDENLEVLEEVLLLLKKYKLELNYAKCTLLKREIEYLGYVISSEGIILNQRKFIKDYALKAMPLHRLTKKDVPFHFDEQCKAAFDLLKGELTSSPVLHIYNPLAETELHTDASRQGFGAILLQKQKTDWWAPIAYFSKATIDAEKNYHSFELETLAIVKAENNIKHVLTAVASPWANGQVERVNRFLKSTLAKMAENPAEWKDILGGAQYVINNTLNKAIGTTPSKLLLGYEQRYKGDESLRALIDTLRDSDVNFEKEREELRDSAKIVNRRLQEYNKIQYDKRHKKNKLYQAGDFVLVKVLQHKPGSNQKLVPKYKGPYLVKTVLKKNRFVITDIPGFNIKQKPLNTIMSADKLKPWIKISSPKENGKAE
ncbi:PREDICTED: uncharacterized protein K02A2.6-like, partial [Wasmannia auropunctata]|uniref:uncharacterized protein K02A2.6-like n=1 Tax=Wasmannia auropunctata TaxID=64793 RepID=UPI0005EF4A5F